MSWNPNKSPCKNCEQHFERDDIVLESTKICAITCPELILHQKAMATAEKIGMPKPGRCTACRRVSIFDFCEACRVAVGKEIARRNMPQIETPKKQKNANPKNFKWFTIFKVKKAHICEICDCKINAGTECLARHTAPSQGNYRHCHRECFDGLNKEAVA